MIAIRAVQVREYALKPRRDHVQQIGLHVHRGGHQLLVEEAIGLTLEQLAPGSYDVLLDGSAMAGLVRSVHRNGPGSEWYIELLDEVPAGERPAPFTNQRHVFRSRPKALEWLGVVESTAGANEVT